MIFNDDYFDMDVNKSNEHTSVTLCEDTLINSTMTGIMNISEISDDNLSNTSTMQNTDTNGENECTIENSLILFNEKSAFLNIETDESDYELEKSVTSDVNDENQISPDKDKSNCNHTLEAAMDETSDIITEPRPPVVAVSTAWNTKSLQTEVTEPRDLNEVSNIKELYMSMKYIK